MSTPGTYALLLHLEIPQTVAVGALGALAFPSGWYLYMGSARGPGGLAARLARHRRRADKRFHWHIDYLRAVTTLAEVWTSSGEQRQECNWAAAAAALPGAGIGMKGFGTSDCHCPTHLFHYSKRPQASAFMPMIRSGLVLELVDDI